MNIISAHISIDWLETELQILQRLERYGRTAYKSEAKITKDSAEAFVKMIVKKGHLSVLEHVSISARVITDRGICYSEDTDVLTNEGWKPWSSVQGDELFATLTPEHNVEYQSASEIIRKDYSGKMYQLQTSMIDLCVTPEHNLYIQKHDTQAAKRKEEPWQFIPAQTIIGKRVSHKRDAKLRRSGVSNFRIPDFVTTQGGKWGGIVPHTRKGRICSAKTFAKFLGYWLAEGSLDHHKGSSYRISLFQNHGPVLDEMYQLLQDMGYKPNKHLNGKSKVNHRLTVCDAALYHYLEPYHKALNKRIPREVLNTFTGADLWKLIFRFVKGDGSIHCENGHMQMYTISQGLADDLQEAAFHAGISATIWIDDRVGQQGGRLGITNKHPCYVISLVTGKNTPLVNHGKKTFRGVPHEQWLPYKGKVFCATVPNHILYVRRNGRPCWSGNSHEIVRHRIASYTQESTRYCDYGKDGKLTFIMPTFLKSRSDQDPLYKVWHSSMETAERHYLGMLEMRAKPQEARSVLPNSLKTEIVMTMNLREWKHFFDLRTSLAAHPDMQDVAGQLLGGFKRHLPSIF